MWGAARAETPVTRALQCVQLGLRVTRDVTACFREPPSWFFLLARPRCLPPLAIPLSYPGRAQVI